MKIRKPLKFIQKENLTEFNIENINGAIFIKTKDFKQLIKPSEYQKIRDNEVKETVKVSDGLPFPEMKGKKK